MSYKRIITAAILFAVLPPVAAKSLKSSLRDCGEIESSEQRLVCFDKLLASKNHETNENDQSPPPITDEIGLAIQKEAEPNVEHSVVIKSCESSRSVNRLFFYLDNGQVWRQKNVKWLSKRDCQSNGVIREDFFGFTLFIEAKNKAVRVSRVR